ncbi:chromate transporter [Paenibacillus arenilitoris]|uniref:Chromate transporter n=1 Tax=Paenibacillus arenilitoris TaxID=2772299 RepID=A0A927CGP6_9BACL|nr:chromate transporter [Paenibacillus arenilitoris]MBD2867225.1 chromate transporter [Paenibacillus arenilitoris]
MGLEKWKMLWSLFVVFLKIGPVTFGGGYAMIPVIEREVVEKRKWLRAEDVADVFAVAGSVPGAIAINSATFIGYRIAGVAGAVAATIGVLLPTFCIVLALSLFFLEMKDNPKVEAAFLSIRATIVALIVFAAYKTWKTAAVDKATVALIAVTVVTLVFFNQYVHPVALIFGGACAGIAIVWLRKKLGLKSKRKLHKDEQVYDYMI